MIRALRSSVLAAIALGVPFGASARAAEIAVVKSGPVAAWQPALSALRAALPGHTVSEYDLENSRAESARVVPTVRGRAAVVVAFGPLAAQVMREMLTGVPLVYCMVNDPAEIGLQGASNTTGVVLFAPVRNQLAAFRAVNPTARRVGIVVSSPAARRYADEAVRAGSGLGLEIVVVGITSVTQVPQTMREMLTGRQAVDAVWMLPDPILTDNATRRFMLTAALGARKPVYASSAALVAEGALVSHAPDLASIGQSAGELVSRILAGQKAERLPPVVPRSEVFINKRIADNLRLALTPQVLQAAKLF